MNASVFFRSTRLQLIVLPSALLLSHALYTCRGDSIVKQAAAEQKAAHDEVNNKNKPITADKSNMKSKHVVRIEHCSSWYVA